MTSTEVRFDVTDGVAVIELSRPAKRNAVTPAMWDKLIEYTSAASERREVHSVLVTGSGGAFCAGADLGAVKDIQGNVAGDYRALAIRGITAVAECSVPTIALINGACVGAGCSIALACDLRFASPDAFFSVPAVRHGIVYDEDSIERLSALIGPAHAARMLYTAERVGAARAAQIGLVDECAENPASLAEHISSTTSAADRDTLIATKRLLWSQRRSHVTTG